jgi:glycine oxidase
MASDCIIVGGGTVGMLTARELRGQGAQVVVIDQVGAGRESSWAGGGILSPLHPWRYDDAVTVLARWGQAQYPSIAANVADATGVDPQWTRSGMLVLSPPDDAAASAWARRWDYAMERLEHDRLGAVQPGLGPVAESGLWLPELAQIRTPRLARALKLSLVRSGVEVREYTEVVGIQTEGDRVTGVRTARGTEPAGQVVVAAGAWSGKLLANLGVDIGIAPVRGQIVLFHARPGLLDRIILHGERYLIPRRDGRVLVGSTLEHVGFDKTLTEAARTELRTAAVELLPALARFPVETQWAGLRPGKPDGIPYVAEYPRVRNLYVNTGHYRNGVVLAPASARLLTDLMLGLEPSFDPVPYRLPAG